MLPRDAISLLNPMGACRHVGPMAHAGICTACNIAGEAKLRGPDVLFSRYFFLDARSA